MGYRLRQDEDQTRFIIHAGEQEAALAAVQALPGSYQWIEERWRGRLTLVATLAAWRWQARTSVTGDIIGLEFIGENLGDEDVLFAALAPFVAEDSWIPCDGNRGEDHWAWWFHDGRCWEVPGAIVYTRDEAVPYTISKGETHAR